MTKAEMVEFIVDMFNKHATSPIGDTDKKYIIKVACERNKKWEIENRYLKCLDLEKLQYTNSTITSRCNNALWELTYINICPGC